MSVNANTALIASNDIALYRERLKINSNIDDIESMINNVFKPAASYKFPKRRNRTFRLKWLTAYNWLRYSPSQDDDYCLPCVLFGDKFPSKNSKVKRLFSEPFNHWPDAVSIFLIPLRVVSNF